MPNRRSAVGAMSMSAGSSGVDRPVAEEHAGHQPRIDAVVAAPRLHVVLEDRPGDDAGRAVPRRPVAGVVADEEVRRVLEIRARHRAPRYRTPRGSPTCSSFRIAQAVQLADDLAPSARALRRRARRCPAARGPAGSGTCRSGRGSRRAFASSPRRAATRLVRRALASASDSPRDAASVQVHAAPERAEAVVRDHHQHVAVAQPLDHAADQRVVVLVELANRVACAVASSRPRAAG